jgi:hypothetical protein
MWSDGEPIDPSPRIDQAVNSGFPWLEIQCARCKMPSDVDLAAMKHPPTTFVHDLAGPQMRQSRPTPGSAFATIGLAATAPPTGRLKCAISTRSPPTRPPKQLLRMEPEGATTNIDNAR